jgi:hypothetical protein
MIIFTLDSVPKPDPDPILFREPAPLKQIISNPGGSGSGSTALVEMPPPPLSVRSFMTGF